jgi:hypothetical protein
MVILGDVRSHRGIAGTKDPPHRSTVQARGTPKTYAKVNRLTIRSSTINYVGFLLVCPNFVSPAMRLPVFLMR